jgi:hypothetical protein
MNLTGIRLPRQSVSARRLPASIKIDTNGDMRVNILNLNNKYYDFWEIMNRGDKRNFTN